MKINEKDMLKNFISEFKEKEERRKELRTRIVKSLNKIENELYDDKDSSNKGLLSRVNDLDEAVKEIAGLVKRTKMRNEVILGIMGTLALAVISQLVSHYVKIF